MHRSPEPTDPHSGSTGHDPTAPRRFRAASMEEALEQARAELGPDIEIVEANRIRRGGVGGFFATDLGVELTVIPGPGTSHTGASADWPGTTWDSLGSTGATPSVQHSRDEFEQRLNREFRDEGATGEPLGDEFIDPVRGTVHRPLGADDRRPNPDTVDRRPNLDADGGGDDFMNRDVSEFERIIARIGRDDTFSDDTTPAGRPNDPRLDEQPRAHTTSRTPLFDDHDFDDHDLDDHDFDDDDFDDHTLDRRALDSHTLDSRELDSRDLDGDFDSHGAQERPRPHSLPDRRSDASSIAQALAAMQRAQASDAFAESSAPPASASVDIPGTGQPVDHASADADAAAWLERTLAGLRDGTAGEDAVLDGLAARRPGGPAAATPRSVGDAIIAPIDDMRAPAAARRHTDNATSPDQTPGYGDGRNPATADPLVTPTPDGARAAQPAPAPTREPAPGTGAPEIALEPTAPAQPPAANSPVGYAIDLTKDAAGGLISQLANVHTIDGSPLADIKALSVSVKMPDGAVVDFTAKLDRGSAAKRKG